MARKKPDEEKKRNPTSFRFSDDTEQIITKLSEKLGLGRQAVVEMALRRTWAWENKYGNQE